MKSLSLFAASALSLALAGCASIPPKSAAIHQAEAQQSQLYSGVRYERRTVDGPSIAHILHIDLTQPELRFALTEGDRSRGMEHVAKLTTTYLADRHAQVAINASYFLPFKGGSKGADDYYPHVGDPVNVSGAEYVDGKIISPVETDEDPRVDSILCFDQAKVVIVDGQICPTAYSNGVAAGPRLLDAGSEKSSTLPYAINAHPRTAFGLSADRKRAWIVIVDGRQNHSKGVTLPELTHLFKSLGASDAMNLDGGGSTTAAVEDEEGRPRLLNSPIHTGIEGRERPVANHILLFAPHRHAVQGKKP